MKLKSFLFVFIFSLLAGFTFAQNNPYKNGSPEWLVYRFFAEKSFPDKAKYYTGEMVQDLKNPSIGEELNGLGTVTIRRIYLEPITAMYAASIKVGNKATDFYAYLLNVNGRWRIQFVRKFQLPMFIYQTADSLSQLSQLPDSSASLLKMLNLMISTDEVIKNHLKENTASFNKLLTAFEDKDKETMLNLLDELGLNSVFKDRKYPGVTFVQIGGFDSIEVGYFFAGSNASPPKINPNEFIYIEEIVSGWYVYRRI